MKGWMLLLGVVAGLGSLMPQRAIAADQIVLIYGNIERSVAVEDLTTLAETGEVSSQLDSYFDLANVEPERVKDLLVEEISVDGVALDRNLNNVLGDAVLDRISDVIYPEPRSSGRGAMRAALVLSSVDDNKVTLAEILQNYPTSRVYIDTERLADAYQDIQSASQVVNEVLDVLHQLGNLTL